MSFDILLSFLLNPNAEHKEHGAAFVQDGDLLRHAGSDAALQSMAPLFSQAKRARATATPTSIKRWSRAGSPTLC